jgi:SAM-dependent methyltransferase
VEPVSLKNSQTFAIDSNRYAQFRPRYPDELFAFLAAQCSEHDYAWDCATGNGQAAVALTPFFSRIEATDISQEQIQNNIPHPQVRYSVAPAETTEFADNSFDLITAAQSVHWFDLPQFFHEVSRVLKPEGVLAIFGYSSLEAEPQIDRILAANLYPLIEPYWSSGNRLLMNNYGGVILPFPEIPIPRNFKIEMTWDLSHFLGYLSTWSAVKRYTEENGVDPVIQLGEVLSPAWGDPHIPRRFFIPVVVKACHKPA